MKARQGIRQRGRSAIAPFALAVGALVSVALPARGAQRALGTVTVKGQTSTLRHVVATRETDPDDPAKRWLVLLVSDRPVPPADRSPGRLRALAAEEKVKAVRVVLSEGLDRVEAAAYHWNLESSGARPPERPTIDLMRLDEKEIEAEVGSKMLGQEWHFHARFAAAIEEGGVLDLEEEAAASSRDEGEGASPEKAKKLQLAKLGYEYTEEMFVRAVMDGEVSAVKLFLELGMSANTKAERFGPILMAAVVSCGRDREAPRGEVVNLLLASGANPKAADENDASAVLWASELCPVGVVKALIAAGADVNARAKGSATPLMMAELSNRADVVKVLKAAGAKK